MKKYRVRLSRWAMPDAKVEEVEVERETGSFVWIGGRRNAKRTEYENYFDTWDEAKTALVEQGTERINSLEMQLERYKGVFENIKGLAR